MPAGLVINPVHMKKENDGKMMMTQRAASGRDMRMLTVTAALSAISFILAFLTHFPLIY